MFKFEWEQDWNLLKVNGKSIDDLMDSEDGAVVGGMCDILRIIIDHLTEEKREDTKLQDSVKAYIEQEAIKYIPDWLLERL